MTIDELLTNATTLDDVRVTHEHTFRLESGTRHVEFKAETRDALDKAAKFAAEMLWDALHPEEMEARVKFLRLAFEKTAANEGELSP